MGSFQAKKWAVFKRKKHKCSIRGFFIHLGDSVVNNSNKIGRVYAKDSATKVAFGLAKNNETPIYTPATYSRNVTYLLVLKYNFVPGGDNDLVSLFIYAPPACAPSVEPPPTIGPLGVGENDLPNVGKIVLTQGANAHAPVLVIDGICVFNHWDNGALPVEMSAFNSSVTGRDVTLTWVTTSESNNSGFDIERRSRESGDWTKIGNVAGFGTSGNSQSYNFTDRNLMSGGFNYRLKQIDFNGNFKYYNLSSEVIIGMPSKFELSQNYPNPFNPSTQIRYGIPNDGFVSIKVFDNLGREVSTLVNEFKTAGYYSIEFKATNLSSGLFYYRIETNGFIKIMKMSLIK